MPFFRADKILYNQHCFALAFNFCRYFLLKSLVNRSRLEFLE